MRDEREVMVAEGETYRSPYISALLNLPTR